MHSSLSRIPKISVSSLLREEIPHAMEEDEIIAYGNESERFAGLLNAEIRRPMNGGVLDPREPGGLKSIREILALMLHPIAGKNRPKICFTVPAAP